MRLTLVSVPKDMQAGIDAIRKDFPDRFGAKGLNVTIRVDATMHPGENRVGQDGNAVIITAGGKTGVFRALGRLMGAVQTKGALSFSEKPAFDMVGIMLDNSRNAVMSVEAVKAYTRRCALMGINTIMLYTEETYEVPSEPFFGYLRGRYSQADLKAIDAYSAEFGVEMFPCIQTLGHLEQFLQWDAASKYRDTANVICARNEDVDGLIDRCMEASISCFRSKRIHLGMDEAWGLGSGEFKKKFGDVPPFEIMNDHLARVRDICKSKGLTPMIWSDMYFRLGSERHEYYDKDWKITPEVIANIPKDVQLVYWDYYHVTVEHYEQFIDFHRKLGTETVMAGGVWTWGRMWCGLPYSIRATDACMTACRNKGLREVFVTMWGDDGAECDYSSALPGLQHFAELAYAPTVDPELRAANLRGSCDFHFDDWMLSSQLDANEFFKDNDGGPISAGKTLLWQDPVMALMEPITTDRPIPAFYTKLAAQLMKASRKTPSSVRLRLPALMAKVIGLKTNLHEKLAAVYKSGKRAGVKGLLEKDVKPLRAAVISLWKEHRSVWMQTNHPFGWEVIEARYGGLMARMDTLIDRLKGWQTKQLDSLPELEAPILDAWPWAKPNLPWSNHARMKTPSCIK